MYCTKCGKKIEESAKFCTGCGAKLENITAPAEPKTVSLEKAVTEAESVEPEVSEVAALEIATPEIIASEVVTEVSETEKVVSEATSSENVVSEAVVSETAVTVPGESEQAITKQGKGTVKLWMIIVPIASLLFLIVAVVLLCVVLFMVKNGSTEDNKALAENSQQVEEVLDESIDKEVTDSDSMESVQEEHLDEESDEQNSESKQEESDDARWEDSSVTLVTGSGNQATGNFAKIIGQKSDSSDYEDDYEYEEECEEDYYILPYSDSQKLEESDLKGLTEEECRIARNEIYARHGRKFRNEELQEYFDSMPWYAGVYEADKFKDTWLNEYENYNKDFIAKYEKKMGYNQ